MGASGQGGGGVLCSGGGVPGSQGLGEHRRCSMGPGPPRAFHLKRSCEWASREVSRPPSLPVLRNQIERSLWPRALNSRQPLSSSRPSPLAEKREEPTCKRKIRFRFPPINFLFNVTRPHCGRGKHVTQAINLWLWCLWPLSSSWGQD